ncbi:MAG: hypothetical protein ACOC1K_01500 [Nanoarchaeota archaeon]
MSTFVIDLDNTICRTPKHKDSSIYNYRRSVPVKNVKRTINELYSAGNKIIIFTSRGMRTFKEDFLEIEKTVLPGIKEFLNKNEILYHEIRIGKPWGEDVYYIDDRCLTINQFLSQKPDTFKDIIKKNNSLMSK